jgi:hypothetical protein
MEQYQLRSDRARIEKRSDQRQVALAHQVKD